MDTTPLETEIDLLHQRICYALGDPKRILILYLLNDGDKGVNELTALMHLPQSTVSRHLRVLRERGLVNTTRQGTSVIYSLSDPDLIVALDTLRQVLNRQLSNQTKMAAAITQ
ncbi:MAG: ArsR/SmtB family transcription factor [Anaerolineaceae bacterium]|jgi:ArsR family transcriptional regulator